MSELLSPDQIQALRELSRRLSTNNVSFVVIGGLAAIAWGAKRPLVDIDIQISKVDFSKVADIFSDEIKVKHRHYKTDNWDIYQMIVQLHNVGIDICQAEEFYAKKAGEELLLPNSINAAPIKRIAGVDIAVLPFDVLVEYKEFMRRKVDIEDLSSLVRLQQ